jgi:DNA-binding response OmpR family regulator
MACILLADDSREFAEMIGASLQKMGHDVVIAYNGLEALDAAQKRTFDLMILDAVMPKIGGIELCQRLRDEPATATVPILLLLAKGRPGNEVRDFEVGTDDYLTKPFTFQELALRVKAFLHRAEMALSEDRALVKVGSLSLDARTFEVNAGGKIVLLTPVEFELLRFLMAWAGEVISSDRLLQEVWGYPPGVGSPGLVRMYIRKLRLKIEQSPSNPIYIKTIRRRGYILSPVMRLL